MDVSIDNPRKILSPQPAVGEAMSEIVTLQLEQQIDELKNDMNAKSTAFAEEKESLLKTISDVQTTGSGPSTIQRIGFRFFKVSKSW